VTLNKGDGMGMLDQKVSIITGAGGGIGRATAEIFAREGAVLVLSDLPNAGGQETAELVRSQAGEAIFVAADVTKRAEVASIVAAAIDTYGRLDCAFNNAGIVGVLHPLNGYPDDVFEAVLNVNFKGTWYCMQEELAVMAKAGKGAIVNTASVYGEVGAANTPIYTATKHAVMGMTKVAALDHVTENIRVNAVLPGVIDTAMPAALMEGVPGGADAFIPTMPIGRLGRASEIGEAVAWLCSDRASLVTGTGLDVDGGHNAH
jgi:NAD(P)-dependent dehydrogenase (short-subunit alcohol dehydrogenase family)